MALNRLKAAFTKRTGSTNLQVRRRLHLDDHPSLYPIYAVGDVHGCLDQLLDVEARILDDLATTGRNGLVVMLGDYVDRGPNSAGVLAHLRRPTLGPFKRVALCGNHDDILSSLPETPGRILDWIAAGGVATLMSYGLDIDYLTSRSRLSNEALANLIAEAIPEGDLSFLKSLPVSLRVGGYLFVHAGVRPGIQFHLQSDDDLMWIRDPFITKGPELDLLVVHGHTPSSRPTIGPRRIGIDTKAYATGNLTALKIDSGTASVL